MLSDPWIFTGGVGTAALNHLSISSLDRGEGSFHDIYKIRSIRHGQ